MIQEEILSDGTLTLRAVELSDVDILYRWENDTTQWITNNAFAPYSRKQLWDYATITTETYSNRETYVS